MQLEQARIVIRERSFPELLDLSLVVVRAHFWPICCAWLWGVLPTLVACDRLLQRMRPDEFSNPLDYARFLWLQAMVAFALVPISTAPITLYLGRVMFTDRPSWNTIARDFVKSLPQLVILQLVLRGFVCLWGITWFWAYARWAYLNEVLLLERNPLLRAPPGGTTTLRRASELHEHYFGMLLGRWLTSLAVGAPLALSALVLLWLLRMDLFDVPDYFDTTVWRWLWPFSLWLILGFFAVVRFLSYIDLRIRSEGWEIELRLRAEAAHWEDVVDRSSLHVSAAPSLTRPAGALLLLLAALSMLAFVGTARASNFESAVVLVTEDIAADPPAKINVEDELGNSDAIDDSGVAPPAPDDPDAQPDRPITEADRANAESDLDEIADVDANANPEAEVAAAREALTSPMWNDYEWYDSDKDALRQIRVRAPWQWPWKSPNVSLDWLRWLAWAVIVGLFIALAYFLTRLYLRGDRKRLDDLASAAVRAPLQRVQLAALPQLDAPDLADLLAATSRHSAAGRYREALVCLFSHMLVELDHRQQIHLLPGKTNRQYLRELRRRADLAELFAPTMITFEEVFFGHRPLQQAGFEECWNRWPRLASLLEVRGA